MSTATVDAIVLEITIQARAARVFEALVDPAQRMKWWSREGRFETTNVESDLRPGGRWLMSGIGMGRPFTVEGVYRIIEHSRVLAFTWLPSWDEEATETQVRFDLHEQNGSPRAFRNCPLKTRARAARIDLLEVLAAAVEQRVVILVGMPSRICSQLGDVRCAFLEIVGDRLPDRLGALAPLVELGLEVALNISNLRRVRRWARCSPRTPTPSRRTTSPAERPGPIGTGIRIAAGPGSAMSRRGSGTS